MTKEMLEPGGIIDGWWGHYQSVKVIELGIELGYEDHALNEENLNKLIQAYNDNEDEVTLTEKGGPTTRLHNDGFSIAECVHEVQDDVENYINETHVPEGYWFGHHADIGDFGVWEIEDDE